MTQLTDSPGLLNRVRFTLEDAQAAAEEWGFNCGPAALCAVVGKTPNEIREYLGDFEAKGYTNPSLMARILGNLQVPFQRTFQSTTEPASNIVKWPNFGLVRVQWAGPWTEPGVPIRVRYRKTHWIGYKIDPNQVFDVQVFDVNAMNVGGWLPFDEWESVLVPWLLKQVVPDANGRWWPTHCWDIDWTLIGCATDERV